MSETSATTPPSSRAWLRATVLVLLVAVIVAALVLLPVKEYMKSFLEWVQHVGPWGAAAVIFFYVVACVLFLPGSVITLGVGFVFHLWLGTVIVSIGSTLGAAAAFLVGRTIARDWVARQLAARPAFHAIDEAVGREGFKIVLLTRLSPIFPFNLLNYGFGVTKVSFGRYVLASWIGMLPGTVMYVYFGSTLRSLADAFAGKYEGGAAKTAFVVVGLAATVAITLYVTRLARRALQEAVGNTTE